MNLPISVALLALAFVARKGKRSWRVRFVGPMSMVAARMAITLAVIIDSADSDLHGRKWVAGDFWLPETFMVIATAMGGTAIAVQRAIMIKGKARRGHGNGRSDDRHDKGNGQQRHAKFARQGPARAEG